MGGGVTARSFCLTGSIATGQLRPQSATMSFRSSCLMRYCGTHLRGGKRQHSVPPPPSLSSRLPCGGAALSLSSHLVSKPASKESGLLPSSDAVVSALRGWRLHGIHTWQRVLSSTGARELPCVAILRAVQRKQSSLTLRTASASDHSAGQWQCQLWQWHMPGHALCLSLCHSCLSPTRTRSRTAVSPRLAQPAMKRHHHCGRFAPCPR